METWSRTNVERADDDISSSLVETSESGYAIAGYTYSIGASDSNACLIKTDEQGVSPKFPKWFILPFFLFISYVLRAHVEIIKI